MITDIFLIFTPIDYKYQDALTHFAPPLGLIALENYLLSKNSTLNITILDGSTNYTVDDIINIIEKEKPSLVGQSIQLISYKNSLKIAEVAKEIGAINVLGGHHATQMCEAIIKNQSKVIDYVVTGDGEEALYKIINEVSTEDIDNIVYNKNNKVIRNKQVNLILDDLPLIDYDNINLNSYQELLKKSTFENETMLNNYLRLYSHKGCSNRNKSSGCIFCGRADFSVRYKSAENFWLEIEKVINKYNADYIFDVGDDFLGNIDWLNKIVEAKVCLSTYSMGIFGRSNTVTPKSALALKNIGVTDVVIGFESGDDEILHNCNKRNTSSQSNKDAAKLLFSNNIDVTASYVLGIIGENDLTLSNTVRNAEEITEMALKIRGKKMREIAVNLIEPAPGSPIYNSLVKSFPQKYYLNDDISLEELQYDYFKLFFGVKNTKEYTKLRRKFMNVAKNIHSLTDFSDAQGWLANEII
jgi:radical SAM superfamily enzyme YgiQ (UPF0313 family)